MVLQYNIVIDITSVQTIFKQGTNSNYNKKVFCEVVVKMDDIFNVNLNIIVLCILKLLNTNALDITPQTDTTLVENGTVTSENLILPSNSSLNNSRNYNELVIDTNDSNRKKKYEKIKVSIRKHSVNTHTDDGDIGSDSVKHDNVDKTLTNHGVGHTDDKNIITHEIYSTETRESHENEHSTVHAPYVYNFKQHDHDGNVITQHGVYSHVNDEKTETNEQILRNKNFDGYEYDMESPYTEIMTDDEVGSANTNDLNTVTSVVGHASDIVTDHRTNINTDAFDNAQKRTRTDSVAKNNLNDVLSLKSTSNSKSNDHAKSLSLNDPRQETDIDEALLEFKAMVCEKNKQNLQDFWAMLREYLMTNGGFHSDDIVKLFKLLSIFTKLHNAAKNGADIDPMVERIVYILDNEIYLDKPKPNDDHKEYIFPYPCLSECGIQQPIDVNSKDEFIITSAQTDNPNKAINEKHDYKIIKLNNDYNLWDTYTKPDQGEVITGKKPISYDIYKYLKYGNLGTKDYPDKSRPVLLENNINEDLKQNPNFFNSGEILHSTIHALKPIYAQINSHRPQDLPSKPVVPHYDVYEYNAKLRPTATEVKDKPDTQYNYLSYYGKTKPIINTFQDLAAFSVPSKEYNLEMSTNTPFGMYNLNNAYVINPYEILTEFQKNPDIYMNSVVAYPNMGGQRPYYTWDGQFPNLLNVHKLPFFTQQDKLDDRWKSPLGVHQTPNVNDKFTVTETTQLFDSKPYSKDNDKTWLLNKNSNNYGIKSNIIATKLKPFFKTETLSIDVKSPEKSLSIKDENRPDLNYFGQMDKQLGFKDNSFTHPKYPSMDGLNYFDILFNGRNPNIYKDDSFTHKTLKNSAKLSQQLLLHDKFGDKSYNNMNTFNYNPYGNYLSDFNLLNALNIEKGKQSNNINQDNYLYKYDLYLPGETEKSLKTTNELDVVQRLGQETDLQFRVLKESAYPVADNFEKLNGSPKKTGISEVALDQTHSAANENMMAQCKFNNVLLENLYAIVKSLNNNK